MNKAYNNKLGFLKQSGIYALCNGFTPLLALIALPLFTRHLTPYDFGVMSMFGVLFGIIKAFAGLSVHGAIGRQYVDDDNTDIAVYVTNCIWILLASSCLVAVTLAIFRNVIESFTGFPQEWLWTVLVIAVCFFFQLIIKILWQMRHKALSYAIFECSLAIVVVGSSLWFVIHKHMDWTGRIYGQLTGHILFGIAALLALKFNGFLKPGLNRKYIKSALLFGVPLIPHAFGMWVINMTDRLLITNMLDIEQTGIYSIGARLAMVILFIQDAFIRAWTPHFYKMLKQGDTVTKKTIVKYTYIFSFVLLFASLVFGLLCPGLIKRFLDIRFHPSGQFVIWIAVGYAFNGMYKLASGYMFFLRKTYIVTCITFLTALLNVALSIFLIKANGAIGAAQGTMLAFMISCLFTWAAAARVYKMPWLSFLTKERS